MKKLLTVQEIAQWRDYLIDLEINKTYNFHEIHYPKVSGVFHDFCWRKIKNCWEITNTYDLELSKKIPVMLEEFLELYKQNSDIYILHLISNKEILGREISFEEEYEYRKERNFKEGHPYFKKLIEISKQINAVLEPLGYNNGLGIVDICSRPTTFLVIEYEDFNDDFRCDYMVNTTIEDKIEAAKNSLLSFVLGDVLGTPIQFIQRKNLQEYLSEYSYEELVKKRENITPPFGYWSDDTSMTLCTMASIIEKNEIDLKDITKKFIKWIFEGYMTPEGKAFDIGKTTLMSISNYANEEKYEQWKKDTGDTNLKIKTSQKFPNGQDDINSNGNGSLMRILPVSLFCYFKNFTEHETFEIIKYVSSITHAHSISILGCYIYTQIIFSILEGKNKDDIIKSLCSISVPDDYKQWLDEYKDVLSGKIVNKKDDELNSTGYVKYSLEVALWGFYNSCSEEDCIFKIIGLGNDTDTNAAIGASLSGLYYGLRKSFASESFTNKITNKSEIFDLVNKYTDCLLLSILRINKYH